jgi:hypothetical protein
MAITLTLWMMAVVWCDGCQRDLARVTAREDEREAFKGTIGTVIIDHGRANGRDHWGTCRQVVEDVTLDELRAVLSADTAR